MTTVRYLTRRTLMRACLRIADEITVVGYGAGRNFSWVHQCEVDGPTILSFEKVSHCSQITLILEENSCYLLFVMFTHIPDLLRCREDQAEMTTSIFTDDLSLDWVWIQV
jgi:hypothetical protein